MNPTHMRMSTNGPSVKSCTGTSYLDSHHNLQAVQSFKISAELVPGFPAEYKIPNAQVPYIKWHSICMEPMHVLLCDSYL